MKTTLNPTFDPRGLSNHGREFQTAFCTKIAAEDSPTIELKLTAKELILVESKLADIRRDRAKADALIQQRNKIIKFVLPTYGWLLMATLVIVGLQGFKCWGFALDLSFLKWLCVATIGQMAGLLSLLHWVFRGGEIKGPR